MRAAERYTTDACFRILARTWPLYGEITATSLSNTPASSRPLQGRSRSATRHVIEVTEMTQPSRRAGGGEEREISNAEEQGGAAGEKERRMGAGSRGSSVREVLCVMCMRAKRVIVHPATRNKRRCDPIRYDTIVLISFIPSPPTAVPAYCT